MVEQARLFNLLVEYVNHDQPQASDSIIPLSQLPMDLRKEERASRGNKRVLFEIDVSGRLPERGLVRVRANEDVTLAKPLSSLLVKLSRKPRGYGRKRRRRSSALSRKTSNKFPSPETFHPVCATIVDNPGITYIIAQISSIRIRTSEQLSVLTARTRFL
jgi:hypothetical protein